MGDRSLGISVLGSPEAKEPIPITCGYEAGLEGLSIVVLKGSLISIQCRRHTTVRQISSLPPTDQPFFTLP